MTLSEFIGSACFVLFIIYWITLNFFSNTKTPQSTERPQIKPYSFLKSAGEKISKAKARDLILKK
jgi:beta-lactam-binding protein with PASTA domain